MTGQAQGGWPSWADELGRALAFQSQFVLSGNIRDIYPTPTPDGVVLKPIVETLWELLHARGYQFLVIYDPVDGIRIMPEEQAPAARALNLPTDVSLERLPEAMAAVARAQNTAAAFVVDYASRITARPQDLTEDQRAFFVACEKLAHQTRHLRPATEDGVPPFNPIIWLINRPNDLPDWFVVGNDTIRSLVAGLPDRQARRQVAELLASRFMGAAELDEVRRAKLIDQFALLTDGMSLRSLMAIGELARAQRMELDRVGDAIRAYKVGAPDDPWKQPLVRQSIRGGEQVLGARVKGQGQATRKTLDILTRSVMGLTGAQANRSGGRPRGVLFFAGPTGVGKTEMAKAITEVLFGDEGAYHRFDMSEFASEHSEARLIGAPPGYVGHDAGGELVNAVRQRPFSVLLFDEIEKGHPRILDKFLQILEDGRLTDGRGETVFFSEAVIIFTSNLGIYVEDADGRRSQNVTPADDYETVSSRVLSAIERFFRFDIQRPELLNRIGDNIVVFDFIREKVAVEIFRKMLGNITARVKEEHGIELAISPAALETLQEKCLGDLGHGGRGIGNSLETNLINPLGRALFAQDFAEGSSVMIQGFAASDGHWEVRLS